jgi:Holliday junction resolvasome RuvABC DNA-binding subunit
MVGLGFSQREASTLVEEITREQALASVEEVIRAVFQRMQKG